MKDVLRIAVEEPSQVGEARRLAIALSRAFHFQEIDIGKIALQITELGTNLVKHTQGGEIILRSLDCLDSHGIEIIAWDRGPGIPDIHLSLQDGYSTRGSLGIGLGAVYRSSPLFDLYTQENKGTVICTRLWAKEPKNPLPPRAFEVGAIQFPKEAEEICGDAWTVHQTSERFICIVADGLGHGEAAAEAATDAVKLFCDSVNLSPSSILEKIHKGLRSTRGAAVAIVSIERNAKILKFAGVGNIFCRIASSTGVRSLLSHNGIVGGVTPKIQEYAYPWNESDVLLMNTDGLKSQFTLEEYPGLLYHHPSTIAAVLFRDYNRKSDDSTILVVKERKGSLWQSSIPS